METKWKCQFKNPPEPITVGQKLLLLCDGEPKKTFRHPIRIEFLDNKHDYSLYVLKTLNKEDHFLILEVTSYRTGEFKHPFRITDGEQNFIVEDLSFSVQSVLEKPQESPQGSFGPFRPPLPVWYLTTMLLAFACIAVCLFIFLKRWVQRKRYIQKILDRKTHLNPSKSFILGLRQQVKDSEYSIKKLEKLFKKFLEDLFFIPAIDKTTEQIMNSLKKYHPLIYKKDGQNLRQILNEFSTLDQKTIGQQSFLKLKKVCQKIVFLLDNQRKLNDLA